MPETFVSPEIKVFCSDKIKFSTIENISKTVFKKYNSNDVISLDGLRVKNSHGWWLIRASNTEEALVVRFEGKSDLYRKGPSGGLGCMTPDSFPIFDRFFENVYMIADANHGYKMIGVGQLVAEEIMGEKKVSKMFDYQKFNINRFGEDYMQEFWNLVNGGENTLHRQGKNTL